MAVRDKDAVPKKRKEKDPWSGTTKEIGAHVRSQYEKGLEGISQQLMDYWANHAFLLGDQWLWINKRTRSLEELPRDPERVMATVNRLHPTSRAIMAKAMQRELVFEVTPTAADDATLQAARLGESILEAKRQSANWELIREKATWMAWKGGTAALAVDWDPEANSPLLLESGEELPQGDSIETPLSIAEFVVQPGVRDPERALWWVKAQVLPPSAVKAAFKLDSEPDPDASAGLTPFQNKLLSAANGNSDQRTDLTLVLTYYERPNHDHPKGYVCVVVGGEVVDGPHDWPFPFKDRLNFTVMRETPDETHWAGRTVLTQARPIQVALNASWSSIIEHMKLAGNARLATPMSGLDLIDQFTDLPAEIAPYADGSVPPGWIAPPPMPGWWIQQPEMLAQEMDDVLGYHDVSRGQSPANIESGYGLSVLAENDATPTVRLVKEVANAMSRMSSMVLKLYEHMVDDTREAVVAEPGLPPDTIPWTGKDLMGQTSVTIPLDAVLPRSRAGMMAAAEKMAEMGLIQSAEQFTKMAELPGHRDLVQALAPDVARARRENHVMAMGRAAVPEDWDEHKVHITEHNVFRKSPRYEGLDDEAKAIFQEHVQAHEVLSMEEMGRQTAKAAMGPGAAAAADAGGAPTLEAGEIPPEALQAAIQGNYEDVPAAGTPEAAAQAASGGVPPEAAPMPNPTAPEGGPQ